VFCFKCNYILLWLKRHVFKSPVPVVFLPRELVAWWEHRILKLRYSHCHGPNDAIALGLCLCYPVIGQKTSCAVAPCGMLVLHESCRILNLNACYIFLWQYRHVFINRTGSGSVFAKGTGSVAGVTFCLNYAMSS
jgi:hypothetical protein